MANPIYREMYDGFNEHARLAFNVGLVIVGGLFLKRVVVLLFHKRQVRGIQAALLFLEEVIACAVMTVGLMGILRGAGKLIALIAGVQEIEP